ncbi:MAG: lipopolysaccharide biosynthesis protein [Solirubrobacteraceae bacterium]
MEPGSLHPERMTGATVWRLAFLAIQGLGSVVMFSALGHVLDRDAMAATAVAQGVIVLAQTVGDFGLSQAAVTVLPTRISARPELEADLLAGAASAYGVAALLGLVLTLLAVPLVPHAAAGPVAVSAPAAAASIIVAGADGLLRSRGVFRRPVLLMATSEGAGFAGLPVALLTHSALLTCAAISAGMALGAFGSVALLVRLRRGGTDRQLRSIARASLPLGLSQVFVVLCTRADTLLAGGLSGLIAAGTFEGTWRVYQLTQYAAGGLASAAAPFIADALGGGRYEAALRLVRRMFIQLAVVGVAGGALMHFGAAPIAHVMTGSLAVPVAGAITPFALLCPLAAVATIAFFTLIGRDGERRFVLGTLVIATIINIGLGVILAPTMGARGVVLGCAVGLAVAYLLLLARFAAVVRALRAQSLAADHQTPSGLTEPTC